MVPVHRGCGRSDPHVISSLRIIVRLIMSLYFMTHVSITFPVVFASGPIVSSPLAFAQQAWKGQLLTSGG